MSKAIVTVAFASKFFTDFAWFLRIGCIVLAIAFFVTSVIIMEKKGAKRWM